MNIQEQLQPVMCNLSVLDEILTKITNFSLNFSFQIHL